MAKTTRQAESIVSLKVTPRGIRPPIWRRLLVLGRMPLGGLHHVIQAAMGWDDDHLHAFDTPAGSTATRTRSTVRPTRSG